MHRTRIRLFSRHMAIPVWRVVGATAHLWRCDLDLLLKRLSHVLLTVSVCATLPAAAANRYWIASGGNWSDTANWSTSSGGSGGAAVPTNSDVAIFDGNSGDALMNVAVDIAGLELETNYTGIVRQTDKTLTIGANGYYQGSGCFSGGDAAITVTINDTAAVPFKMVGGVFTNSTNYLRINHHSFGTDRTAMQLHGGAFVSNEGNLQFYTTVKTGALQTFWWDFSLLEIDATCRKAA